MLIWEAWAATARSQADNPKRETENNFEVAGTKEVMQGRKKVDGIYFASVVLEDRRLIEDNPGELRYVELVKALVIGDDDAI